MQYAVTSPKPSEKKEEEKSIHCVVCVCCIFTVVFVVLCLLFVLCGMSVHLFPKGCVLRCASTVQPFRCSQASVFRYRYRFDPRGEDGG